MKEQFSVTIAIANSKSAGRFARLRNAIKNLYPLRIKLPGLVKIGARLAELYSIKR